jgi:DNA end-binding protein Ku
LEKQKASPRPGTNVIDLMTALQQSLKGGAAKATPAKTKKPAKATGQREMLLPIAGKKAAPKEESKMAKPARALQEHERRASHDRRRPIHCA